MKKKLLILFAIGILVANYGFGQDIPQSQVPSLVVNEFKKSQPKATDIEWEMDGDLYVVEFETKKSKNHEIWYNETGKEVKRKEEISKDHLPEQVLAKIKSDFQNYEINEAEKITEGKTLTYSVEFEIEEEGGEEKELEVIFSADGEILSRTANR